MGCTQTWFAVKGKTAATILNELRLKPAKFDSVQEYPPVGGEIPGGWYVISCANFGGKLFSDETVKQLSAGCELIRGSVNDNEGNAAAEGWKDGHKLWAVYHDPEQGHEHLEIIGTPPSMLTTIREKWKANQRADPESDTIWNIPIDVAEAVTGYNPDKTIPGVKFTYLADASWKGMLYRPILPKLFGKGS